MPVTPEQRGDSWSIAWRQGGRGGQKHRTTWPELKLAERAAEIVEAHRRNISREEVYAAVHGLPMPAPAPPSAPETPKLPTVAEWVETWLAGRTRITPGQKHRYRSQFENEILPRIGSLRLDEVTGADVARVLNELRVGRKDNTVTRYFAAMHALFASAVLEYDGLTNPAKRTDWIRDLVAHDDTGDEEHVYLDREEYGLIRAAADQKAQTLLDALADTGARFSEMTAVFVGDIVADGRQSGVWIKRAWKHDGQRFYLGATKGRNRRFVPIPQRLLSQLLVLAQGRNGNDLLFTAPRGGRIIYSNFRNRFWLPAIAGAKRCPDHPPAAGGQQVEAGELAGPRCGDNGGQERHGKPCGALVSPGWNRCVSHCEVPADAVSTCDCSKRLRQSPSLHDLRHSHVAWLIAAGRPLLVISRRIGHHSTKITEQVYAGILPEVDEETLAAVEAFDTRRAAAGVPASAGRHRVPARRMVQRRAVRR